MLLPEAQEYESLQKGALVLIILFVGSNALLISTKSWNSAKGYANPSNSHFDRDPTDISQGNAFCIFRFVITWESSVLATSITWVFAAEMSCLLLDRPASPRLFAIVDCQGRFIGKKCMRVLAVFDVRKLSFKSTVICKGLSCPLCLILLFPIYNGHFVLRSLYLVLLSFHDISSGNRTLNRVVPHSVYQTMSTSRLRYFAKS